jgi:energy-coupling factor transporter transmembrane protein EcfT
MMLRPLHRVLALLALALLLPWLGRALLLALMLILLVLHLGLGAAALLRLGALLRRSRMLLLAVLVLHLWVTPGAPWWPGAPDWVPSVAGTWLAFDRTLLLVTDLIAVNLLLVTTPVAALVAALTALLRPASSLGVAPEHVARRIGYTLDMLGATGEAVAAARARGDWQAALAELVLRAERAAVPGSDPQRGT